MSKLTRGEFLELSVLLLAGCGSSETASPGSHAGGGGDAGRAPNEEGGDGGRQNLVPADGGRTGGSGGSASAAEGGAPSREDASNPSPSGSPADTGLPSDCAARAEADDFYGTDMPMEALVGNHEQPHEFYLSQAQLDEALAVDYEDETGSPIYLRFDTTVGSGPARGLDPTAPHVHPVLFGRANAEELLAQGSVETGNSPTTDEGGIVHRHRLTVRLC